MSTASGYRALLRLALRRERVKLTAWVLGSVVMTAYFANTIKVTYPDPGDLETVVGFMTGPAGAVMSGPGYGFDHPTHGIVLAGAYALYLMILVAFMNILLVVRQTRAEEETGRQELVRAAAVGRNASLLVTITLAVAAGLAYFVLSWAALSAQYDSASSALLAASIAVAGLVFAAVTFVAAQLTEHARTATGFASVALGLSIAIRGAGDVLETHGSALSWFSPIAWSQQTRAFYADRWWPLALGVVLAVGCIALAVALQARRDVGAGLLPARRGRPIAPSWMGTPVGLATRLERSNVAGWSAGLVLLGVMYGSLTGSVVDSMKDVDSTVVVDIMGGNPDAFVDGYVGVIALVNAFVACCFVIVSAHRLPKDERQGYSEVVLSAAVGRRTYLFSGIGTALVGGTIALVAAGLAAGLSSWASTGDVSLIGSCLGAHLVYLPALAIFAALAAVCFAWRPWALNLVWVVAAYSMVTGLLGRMLDLPDGLVAFGVFDHIAEVPSEHLDLVPWIALLVVAGALLGVAAERYRRRDLLTT